jgi:glycosyltransferase involved in cell wall biosynthesis
VTEPQTTANGSTGAGRSLSIQFFVNFVNEFGTYFRFHNLAVGLTRLGHRVTVFGGDHDSSSRSRKEVRQGVQYHILPEWATRKVFGASCDLPTIVRRFARSYPACDIAHLFQAFPSATAAWARSRARVRFSDWDDLWVNGLFPARIRHWREACPIWATRFLEPRLPRWAGNVTTVSEFLADRARQAKARNISVIHNGYWPEPYPDRTSARRQLGLQENALYVGFMGRTAEELPWCFEALAQNQDRYPGLRLAICGAWRGHLQNMPSSIEQRVDYLGQISPQQTRVFAAALDLGLLPLADTQFNQSRFPIKFCEHIATGVPMLCSTVGECGRLVDEFGWAIPAGKNQFTWLRAFQDTIAGIDRGNLPAVNLDEFQNHMSWDGLSGQLAQTYHAALNVQIPLGQLEARSVGSS